MKNLPKIAYMVDPYSEFNRKISYGVGDYMHRHGPWNILWPYMLRKYRTQGPEDFDFEGMDGIITPARQPEVMDMICKAKRPTVIVASYDYTCNLPSVMTDEAAIGKMAAEHFLARGFRNFGYLEERTGTRLDGRRESFIATVHKAGYEVSCMVQHQRNRQADWATLQTRRAQWLESLLCPVAIMVRNDLLARDLVQTCHNIDINIPEDLAIIGVDDDLPVCMLCTPQLSSIEHNAQQIGYAAAELLTNLMAGKPAPTKPVLVPPRTIVVRQSSDIMAVHNPVVADAINFIRNHASDSINVSDVLKAIPVSRSTLEKAFRSCLGHSIHQQIVDAHINLAKHYLSETDLPIEKIAGLCGFQYSSHLAGSFRKVTGITCTVWRNKFKRR